MKNCLFIVNAGKISPNENGGASVYYSHLELLCLAGYQIKLLACVWDDNDFNSADYDVIKPFVEKIDAYKPIQQKPKQNLNRIWHAIFNPQRFEYYFLNSQNTDFLKLYISQNSIDFVWADWRWAAIWSWGSKLQIPVIYAHHDWEYKLAQLREKPNLKKWFHTFQKKRIDMQLVKAVAACVSGSATETLEIEKISNKKALYLPTTYHKINVSLRPKAKPNIVHLGGMGTTANRLGLERFLALCWPKIKTEIPEIRLKVIGSLKQAPKTLLEKLEDPQIECLGFVADLNTVLYPEDIHIIPWEFNTGTRTRIPQIFNYQQVLVAVKAAVSCCPELVHNDNCLLCDNLNDMTQQIIKLYKDPKKISILATHAKHTFNVSFTPECQFNRLKSFLKTITI